jgi:integrase
MRISDVGKNDVLRVLKNTAHYPDGFYATKTPTAKRCQGAMKAVLDYAAWHNWRDEKTLNPATWKGHLDKALPGPQAVNPTENHPALPWQRIGEFVQDLRRTQAVPVHGNNLRAVAASCLEFQILTAARPGEALNAQWSHIRMDERLWVIPAHGMKERRKHQVPLSDQAIALLEKATSTLVSIYFYSLPPDMWVKTGSFGGPTLYPTVYALAGHHVSLRAVAVRGR